LIWCDAYAPHFAVDCAKSQLNPESHRLVNGSFLLTESFCKNYLFSVTSLWCTLVNPFLVVHPTHILVHHKVHRLKSAGLWDPRCLNDIVTLLFELHQAWRIGSLFLLEFLIVNCAFFRSGDFYEVIPHNSNNA